MATPYRIRYYVVRAIRSVLGPAGTSTSTNRCCGCEESDELAGVPPMRPAHGAASRAKRMPHNRKKNHARPSARSWPQSSSARWRRGGRLRHAVMPSRAATPPSSGTSKRRPTTKARGLGRERTPTSVGHGVVLPIMTEEYGTRPEPRGCATIRSPSRISDLENEFHNNPDVFGNTSTRTRRTSRTGSVRLSGRPSAVRARRESRAVGVQVSAPRARRGRRPLRARFVLVRHAGPSHGTSHRVEHGASTSSPRTKAG